MSARRRERELHDGAAFCVWCGQFITDQTEAAGGKPIAWATEDGDYGCDASPETCDDGVGSHLSPGDVELLILGRATP